MEFYFKTRDEWRKWLEENSSSVEELWMIIFKKHTGKSCISYTEAVEEALCFGWIDGKIKRINDDYYIQRYTARRPGSRWSKYNIERVRKLINQGRMTPSGLAAYNEIFQKPHLVYDNKSSGDPEIPDELLLALKNNKTAFANFIQFPPSSRRIYIDWLNSAKKAETRPGRIKKIVEASRQNRKPGMM
jgi:uncharacterized protein YdeI (YjbR/CyaY-like superfamily)